jgi:hypothetical protein
MDLLTNDTEEVIVQQVTIMQLGSRIEEILKTTVL